MYNNNNNYQLLLTKNQLCLIFASYLMDYHNIYNIPYPIKLLLELYLKITLFKLYYEFVLDFLSIIDIGSFKFFTYKTFPN